MNGNGQVVVAGLFLLSSIVVAMLAVGLFEVPTYEPEAKPLEVFEGNVDPDLFSPAPVELLLQYVGSTQRDLKPEQIYHGVIVQTLAKAAATSRIQAHSGACSGAY